ICAQPATALTLAQAFMSEPLDSAVEFNDEKKDAFLELIRQVAGAVATSWKQEIGNDVLISFHSATEPPFVAATATAIEIKGDALPAVKITLALNKDLDATLASLQIEPEAPALQEAAVSAPAAAPQKLVERAMPQIPAPTAAATPMPSNLDLLLDVELEATIRFGQREMLLKEIYGLMPGTVIELDQTINEPAQLLVAGRTVAWGEVVVVDGNFGLRVTEVASKNQRAEIAFQ